MSIIFALWASSPNFGLPQIFNPIISKNECYLARALLRYNIAPFRSGHWRCSVKKRVLKNFAKFTGKHLCQSLFSNNVSSQSLALVFSCEFCEISKNTFFTEHLQTTASEHSIYQIFQISIFSIHHSIFLKFLKVDSGWLT